ncbi:MAG: hypothetical protein E5X69_01710 [Mesorhizobium sp.]|nr:MAG: hypothetical protein EOR40_28825 [Mesorhizobium sp.]TIP53976.1 MAG: hypothetical protein E5X69_01710 [Mesorhizobium sp.]
MRRLVKPRRPYRKTDDDGLLELVRRLIDERPTYGYRRITALTNRERAKTGEPAVNHKRVFRIMRQNSILLARDAGRRTGRVHDGKVIVMHSNLSWCSGGFEVGCWNGDIIRVAFIIDAHDRELIAWHAVGGSGISGSMIREIMLEAVESRFGALQAPTARMADGQWQCLHRQGDARLRHRAQSHCLLHAGPEPAVERHIRELRQNLQTRSRQSFAGCGHRTWQNRRMVRGLQRNHPHSGLIRAQTQ